MCARLKNPGRGTSKTLDETAGNLPNTVVFRFDFLKSLQDCIIPDNCDICVAPPPLVRLKCASSPGSVYFRNLAVSTVAPGLVRPAWTCGCIIDVQLFIYSSTDVLQRPRALQTRDYLVASFYLKTYYRLKMIGYL